MINRAMLDKRCDGFSLIELLLVITLMGIVAATASAVVGGLTEQDQTNLPFDETKLRLKQLRDAIVGDPSRTLNGEPIISGFVADMGRLPANINELIVKPADAEDWGLQEITVEDSGVSKKIGTHFGGWRGPYLAVMPDSDGVKRFRDGWANNAITGSEDNFGWNVELTPETAPHENIAIQSYGANGIADETEPANPFDKDYPANGQLVSSSDFVVDIGDQLFSVKLNVTPIAPDPVGKSVLGHDLQLNVYYLKDGKQEGPYRGNLLNQALFGVAPHQTIQGRFDNEAMPLTIGAHIAFVSCQEDSPDIPYDGNCPSTIPADEADLIPLQVFKVFPRMSPQLLQFEWNAQ
jgi:prepilin-type N-terminal cleavage/methylation domain-containing protein